jgi:BspA type Leucine rich repeat region (6 copies)
VKTKTILLGWLLLATPAAVQAQFNYTVTNQTVTITGYTGTNLVVAIPSTIDGLSVTSIGVSAFKYLAITSVTIPNSVTNVGDSAFSGCSSLTSVTIPNSVTSIGAGAFQVCSKLTSVTIPNSVTSIGNFAFFLSGITSVTLPNRVSSIGDYEFESCYSLTSVTIPNSVTNIGCNAFAACSSLTSVYFQGDAPAPSLSCDTDVFYLDNVTLYYLPGTLGWDLAFIGRPKAVWRLPYPLILTRNPSFGVRTNQFGFIATWATNLSVVVEAAFDVVSPSWFPVQTYTLTNGWFYFSDPQWKNSPTKFYRVRSR